MLFDTQSRQQNGELVDGIFAPDEAEVIKKILLARVASDDLLWPWSQDGKYSSKSGYHFLKGEADLGSRLHSPTSDI